MVKITITSSVVLLAQVLRCALFLGCRYRRSEGFRSLTLVPNPLFRQCLRQEDVTICMEVDKLTCRSGSPVSLCFKLFSHQNNIFILFSKCSSRSGEANESDADQFSWAGQCRNQVLPGWGMETVRLSTRFVQKYVSSGYPPKTFDYEGEDIIIYPMADVIFLALLSGPEDFLVLSCQKSW